MTDSVDAAAALLELMRVLAKSQTNIVAELLPADAPFYEWAHLPEEDAIDSETGSQYYYHAHAKSEDGKGLHDDEHGHFHTFIRYTNDAGEKVSTPLIGISMTADGLPFRLFAVNGWVTGDKIRPAAEIVSKIDTFEMDQLSPSWIVNLWLTHFIRLYRPAIETILFEHEDRLARWAEAHPGTDESEDRALEVTAQLDIDLHSDLSAVLEDH